MCYGPEIQAIYESIRREPGQTLSQLVEKYQYQRDGDISSLVTGALTMLKDLQFIHQDETRYLPISNHRWSVTDVFRKLNEISKTENDETLDYIFSSLYDELFVKPDKMFIVNIHYHVNSKFTKTMIGHEKVNTWKRIMEFFGLGRRVYSGFYALPHLSLLRQIVSEIGDWEGGLHPFCERNIHPIIPCLTFEGNIFKGLLFGLLELNNQKIIEVSHKQDLPFKSYGQNYEWNWIKVKKKGVLL
jgi:hypothetical protein